MEMKVADVIIKCLETEGIEYSFGICGSHYLAFFHALKKSSIKFISVKHESAAGYMALHYSRIAQKPALLLATAGPGATNLITGIAELFKANLPCFILTPAVASNIQGKNAMQEDSGIGNSYSLNQIMNSITKKSITCIHPENIESYMHDLLRCCYSGRMSPVHLHIPIDYLELPVVYNHLPPECYRIVNNKSIDYAKINGVVETLKKAKDPLLFLGHRSWYPNISSVVEKISTNFGIPVILSASAKGLFNEYSPFFGGIFDIYGHRSAEFLVKKSDLVIAIGEDFSEFSTNKYEPGLFTNKLIQIDIDGLDIGRSYPVLFSLCGNIDVILNGILDEMKRSSINPFYNYDFCKIVNESNRSQLQEMDDESLPLKPQKIFKEISQHLPENAIVVCDIGANGYFSLRNLKVAANSYSISMCNYAMGQGVAGSIGVKLAAPHKTVISICGDGAFLMHGMEIATACHYNLPMIWIVFVDHRYGIVDQSQKLLFNDLDFCTHFSVPNFSKIAEAFNIDYYAGKDLPSLHESLQHAFQKYNHKQSSLIEITFNADELLPLKPRSVKFIQDFGSADSLSSNPHLMKAFKSMLREKV